MGREQRSPFIGKDKFHLNMPLTTGFARADTGFKKGDIIDKRKNGMLTRTQKKDVIKRMIKKQDSHDGRGGSGIIRIPEQISPYPKKTFRGSLRKGWEGVKNIVDEIVPTLVDTQTDKALKRDIEKANPYLTKEFKDFIKKVPMDSRAVSINKFNKNPFMKINPGLDNGASAYQQANRNILGKIRQKIVTGSNEPEVILHEGVHAWDLLKRKELDKSLMKYIKKYENMTPANEADRDEIAGLKNIKRKILSSKLYSGNSSKPFREKDATELRAYQSSNPYFTEKILPKSKEMQKQFEGVYDIEKINKDRENRYAK